MKFKFKKVLNKLFKAKKIHANITTKELSNYQIDQNRISVSGLSSGGFLAHLLHINYPEVFRGVGIFAAGPYNIADIGNILFMRRILGKLKIDPYLIITKFNRALQAGEFGDIELIKKCPVYIFYSKTDPVVNSSVSEALIKLYEHIGIEKLKVESLDTAGHGLPVLSGGLHYQATRTPYLINCNFEASEKALRHIYSNNILQPFKESSLAAGQLVGFDQRPFKKSYANLDYFANKGYVYLPPAALAGEKCGVHLVLHGCQQSLDFVGKKFIVNSGYMDWADSNKLILLFPQTQKTFKNPLACWDWFGAYEKDYATRKSHTMQALIDMVYALQNKE